MYKFHKTCVKIDLIRGTADNGGLTGIWHQVYKPHLGIAYYSYQKFSITLTCNHNLR